MRGEKEQLWGGGSKCNIVLLEDLLTFKECKNIYIGERKKVLTDVGSEVSSIAVGAVGPLRDLWSVTASKLFVR